ncbi:MAG: polyprenyl synthetase family protein [Bacteroidota bacterium]
MKVATDLKAAVEAHIESYNFGAQEPANLYRPMEYILALKGKRIRPILTMLAYQAVSGKAVEDVLNLACAVELFHNFTLMHDDIMDRAPVRRGKPSVHIVWNEDTAILSGDALFAFSMGLVVRDMPHLAAPLTTEFTEVAMGVCEGQMEDMDLATLQDVSIPQYIEMIRKKTAVLLGGCMSLGALAAGAERELVKQFRAFGEQLGVGFQLQDDLMDAFPPEGFGKQVGGDIIENKKTYLYLRALELAKPDQKAALEDWFDNEKEHDAEEKVNAVLAIFQTIGIKEETQRLIESYMQRAIAIGEQLSQSIAFDPLKEYLQVIAKRKL